MSLDRDVRADAWLSYSKREEQGRLTLFLGAAPGVGKTYAMLSRAHELMMQKVHVVVGVVETHGRVETEKLVLGLNVIPRKKIKYKHHILEEMDLDAILKIKPKVVLVDELAHTNMKTSRHEHRWQDVNELLDAGIDVYSTLNIQHLESLNDIVQRVTGANVNETVPDAFFQRLKDIRLIDLPISELLERLKQGKVYVSEQTQYALNGFFKPNHLTALRDLALQFVAENVDIHYRENGHSVGKIIPIQSHLMLVIYDEKFSESLIRRAHRIVERRNTRWSVVYIERGSPKSQKTFAVTQALSLARQLGAETHFIYHENIASAILETAYYYGVSQILLECPVRWCIASPKFYYIFRKILFNPHPFEVTFMQNDDLIKNHQQPMPKMTIARKITLKEVTESIVIITLGLLCASILDRYVGYNDLALIFILTVMAVAVRTQMLITVLSVFACFILYNYFFIEPRYTLQISAHEGVITVFLFLGCALVVGRLASQLKEKIRNLKVANSIAMQLQDLERKLSNCLTLKDVMDIAKMHMQTTLQADVWLQIGNHHQNIDALSEKEVVAANWTQKNLQPCGHFTKTLNQSDWWFIPLPLQKEHGVVGIKYLQRKKQLSFEEQRLIALMIEDIIQTASRIQLSLQLEDARVTNETEKLRSALLSSVSHDLRSPLAAMIGAADTLRYFGKEVPEHDRIELLDMIHSEGGRLDRYIQNLLDMTRLGHEGLTLARTIISIEDVIDSAITRLTTYQPNLKIDTYISSNLLEISVHPALIEQAIFNVLENAAKFSPPDVPIVVNVTNYEDQMLQIDVIDKGVGIPEDEREEIFNMFYTMQRGDRNPIGTGLGLTIVKAIVGAHMGKIEALSAFETYGTLVRIQLPLNLTKE
ncbi:DUF4118 domain-containing protein [Acinetobacter nectaris]|uniref:DUF4118 domain-containing protein n=1 Tax=Acinetobacter nectaris TaxID=1219382 RepID=UPI001F43F22D|nr:ATP-binding protein [Acinetobacter nectaris]MCF9033308.1 sensor histidine kinase KdpD [Acinetobacter nectaris]